jgi:hypothetical protein
VPPPITSTPVVFRSKVGRRQQLPVASAVVADAAVTVTDNEAVLSKIQHAPSTTDIAFFSGDLLPPNSMPQTAEKQD